MLGAAGFLTDGEGALGNRKGFLVPALPIECTYLQIETRCCFEVALLWEAKVGGSQEDENTEAKGPSNSPYARISTRTHLRDLPERSLVTKGKRRISGHTRRSPSPISSLCQVQAEPPNSRTLELLNSNCLVGPPGLEPGTIRL